MKRTLVLSIALSATPAHADRSYTTSATHDCATSREVSINASAATFTFTGVCEKIAINGSGNKIEIDGVTRIAVNGAKNAVDIGAVDRIAVNGSDNVVTYRKSLAKGGPKVGGVGANNRVTRK